MNRRITLSGLLIAGALLIFTVFWVWALFFASKEAVNKIEDQAWSLEAEQICQEATVRREALADFRRIDPNDAELLRERGDLIDQATDVLEGMLNAVMARPLTGEKGLAIVPLWEAEYRAFIANRRDFADEVRGGSNAVFRENEAAGTPISNRLRVFAADNQMPSCGPPRDL